MNSAPAMANAPARLLACPQCQGPLTPDMLAADAVQRCPTCATELRIAAFPAALRPCVKGGFGDLIVEDTESACFHHAGKRAKSACDGCGRFLCDLCDIRMQGRHYCSSCLEHAARFGSIPELESAYSRFDLLSLAVACLPLMLALPVFLALSFIALEVAVGAGLGMLLFPALFSAPIAMYLSIAYRKRSTGPWPRSKATSIVAFIIAACVLAILVAVISFPIYLTLTR